MLAEVVDVDDVGEPVRDLSGNDRYLVFNIGSMLTAKASGNQFDIVEALPVDLIEGAGVRAVSWFMDAGTARKMFNKACGVYYVRVLAAGRGTKPIAAQHVGAVAWPGQWGTGGS